MYACTSIMFVRLLNWRINFECAYASYSDSGTLVNYDIISHFNWGVVGYTVKANE